MIPQDGCVATGPEGPVAFVVMGNGKGSQQRGASRAERQRYERGWERVFGKRKRKKPRMTPRAS
jgi:hypothetical protein